MTTGEPLLSLENRSSFDRPHIGSTYATPASSLLEDSEYCLTRTSDMNNSEEATRSVGDTNCLEKPPSKFSTCCASRKHFSSAESKFFSQFPLEFPSQDRRRLVTWGAMELHNFNSDSAAFEISRATSPDQEKLSKFQKVRHKSMQFEDNYIDDPKRTNDKYEFTGNEIRTSKYTLITFLPKNIYSLSSIELLICISLGLLLSTRFHLWQSLGERRPLSPPACAICYGY